VNGSTEVFEDGCTWGELSAPPSQNTPLDGVEDPRVRMGSQAHLGDEYANLRVPAVPAVDIAGDLPAVDDQMNLRTELRQPLLKTPIGTLVGVASGEDSALVAVGKKWYRLKGCGQFASGFPTTPIFPDSRKTKTEEYLQGCAFDHTSKRDLHMTKVVNDLLEEFGMQGGNIPVGRWAYNVEPSPLTASPLPAVPKYCTLFETLGDKRLASHVMMGLERLLPLFCPSAKASALMGLFPEERMDPAKAGGVQYTYEWGWSHERMLGADVELSDEGLLNLCDNVNLYEVVPMVCPEEVPARHRDTWARCASRLQQFFSHQARDGDTIAQIVWRLGREAGAIRRNLTDNGISWGFYYDHDPNMPNNASTPDNFVLLPRPKSGASQQFIAPINFENAYTRDSFLLGAARTPECNRWPLEEDLGEQDGALFNKFLNRELYALESALGGDKGMANVEYATSMEVDTHVAALLMTAVTDTCVLGFRSGFRMEEDKYPFDEELEEHAYDLLEMALCMSDAM